MKKAELIRIVNTLTNMYIQDRSVYNVSEATAKEELKDILEMSEKEFKEFEKIIFTNN